MDTSAPGLVVLTRDQRLLGVIGRAAAAAGVLPEVLEDPRSVPARWARAPLVLIGADQLAAIAEQALPRRAQVYAVCANAPDRDVLRDALRCAVEAVLELPFDEGRLADLLTDAADGGASQGLLIGVAGGSGGAGASTFAAALGLRLAEQAGAALLIDADRNGGGADHVLGLDDGVGVRWDALEQASGRLSARSLRDALPSCRGLSVVTWPADRAGPLAPTTVRAVLSAGQRGYPVVVVDLPRTDQALLDEVAARCDRVLVVSTVTVPGLAACLHLTKRLPAPSAAVVLRGRGGFGVDEVERLLGIPVWHQMADQRGLDESISLGLGPLRSGRGPLARAASRVVARLDLGRPG